VHDNYKQLSGEFMSEFRLLSCHSYECDVLYHDECVKIGVKSIIVVNYDEQIVDNRDDGIVIASAK
jgi:hypothetical protein